MKVSHDFDTVPEATEVLLFCATGRGETVCLARLHWFVETADDKTQERVLRWQSTWDGARVPAEWTPYAWATFDAPDPGHEDVI